MFSKRSRLLSILLLLTAVASAMIVFRTSADNTTPNVGQGRRVPLTVLQSSAPAIRSDYAKKTLLAPSKDGQTLYSLDAVTGDLIVYQKNGKPERKVVDSFLNVEALAVGAKHELYLAQSDSTVRIVSSDGRRLNAFRTVYPKSLAVLGNGNVVVASPFNGKNLHLYNGQGILLASFADIRSFDANQTENEFLNEGRAVVGPDDQIYYVSVYAPQPYVLRFSSVGKLLGEFQIEGEAVDLQTGFTREFLNRRGVCNGGVTIITSATVDPETGNLWLGMNGLSTQGLVYEYEQSGTKVREFAFMISSKNKRHNVTYVRDIVVSGDSVSVLTSGGTYGFKRSDVLSVDAWKVPTSTSKTSSCPAAQDFSCIANCSQSTTPNPVNCGAEIGNFFPPGSSRRVIETNNCTARQIDSTPGSAKPGGCAATVSWCDTANSNVTGTTSVTVKCTAVPTSN